jgi:MFS family permease
MSFREKSAWISFVCIAVVFGYYFATLFGAVAANPDADPFQDRELLGLFYGSIVVLIVLEVVLHTIVAIRAPKEALTPKDERERLIALKATSVGYLVMAVCTILAGVMVVHHPANRWLLGNIVVLAFVLGEVTRFGAQVVYFRRGG